MSTPSQAAARSTAPRDALAVEHLDVIYRVRGRDRRVLRDVSFRIGRGESYGLVGESGCGKSTIALAVVRYLPRNGRVSGGHDPVDGRDVLALREGELRELRAEHRVDGLPGARPGAQPVDQGRPPGRRGLRDRRRRHARGARARARDARARCRSPTRPAVHEPLSAPALGRHAAARRDRDGARGGAGAADPRRADDRARRDGRGRGARPDLGAARRVRHLAAVHQPQPRRDRARCATASACSTPASWSRRDRRARCSTTRATRTRSGCCAASRARDTRKDARHARHDPGLPADARARLRRAASSPTAAGWPRIAAASEAPPLYDDRRRAAARAATSTSARRRCRASTTADREPPRRRSTGDAPSR